MPYQKEFATNNGNQTLMSSSGIKEMLKVVQYIISDVEHKRLDDFIVSEDTSLDTNKLKYVFVIDGSKFETTVAEGSEAKLCLFHINQCAIDLKNMVNYLKNPFPFPKEYKAIKKDVTLSSFLPTKGMTTLEHKDEKDFFRFSLSSILKNLNNPIMDWLKEKGYKTEGSETLSETYLHLLDHMSYIKNAPHPCPDCRKAGRALTLKMFKEEDEGHYHSHILCKCENNPKTLYPTDLLGFHEQLNNEYSNEALTTQIMLVLERLSLINLLRHIICNGNYQLIEESVFLMDGALAIYSHASWLSEAINKEIMAMKQEVALVVAGIEKTGNFVDHFKKINQHFAVDPLKNNMLYFLDDDYIKQHIKIYDNVGYYGEHNYFGKKFFYKNKVGKLFVVNLAFEDDADKVVDLNQRNTEKYHQKLIRLNDVVTLLDNFSSQAYDNALSLISMANEGVALSSSQQGKKLLNEFVKTLNV